MVNSTFALNIIAYNWEGTAGFFLNLREILFPLRKLFNVPF